MTHSFPGTAARIQTIEGDLMLIETVARLPETIEFSKQSSIVFHAQFHRVKDDRLQEVGLPRELSDETKFPVERQEAFQKFISL
jgi:hypothetical protein